MDKLFLLLIMIPVIGYVVYKIMTYDWEKQAEDCANIGDDMF